MMENNHNHPEQQQHPQELGEASASTSGVPEGERDEAKAPLVTVVIPCYNQAHFLGEAIESVLKQTYPHYEIVVVDDGSSDNTSEVASSYEGVRLIRQENRGLSEARNTGIKHSEGDYLVFLDADDRLLPEALAAGIECFDSRPECAFVFGRYRFMAVDGRPLNAPTLPSDQDDHYVRLLRGPYIGMPAVGMYRRFAFATVGVFDPSVNPAADYDLYLRITRRYPAHLHDTLVAEYRQHGANMTGDPAKMLKSVIETLRRQKAYAKKDERHREAYKTGVRAWHRWYGVPLAAEVRRQVRDGQWRRAAAGAWALLRYYPGGLLLVPNGRYWVHRELQERDRQLRNRDRKVLELTDALEKERAEVQEQEAEIRRLREQKRKAELRAQDLQRQLQEIQDSEAWKLVLKLANLRAKVGGR
jgi:glycosyltransferase involved in cell wall biosynthesis